MTKTKKRVGVIRGGPSSEYGVSLKTGAQVLEALSREHYEPLDILVDKDTQWHIDGAPTSLDRIQGQVDILINALHGAYGEDGSVQRDLELFGIPYTGSQVLGSACAMNKGLTKELLRDTDVNVARHTVFEQSSDLVTDVHDVFRSFSAPWVVKPLTGGSSLGVSIAKNYKELVDAVAHAFEHDTRVLVEEFIDGKEATCGVIEGFKDTEHYALSPLEITPQDKHDFFTYDAKYNGEADKTSDTSFSQEEINALQQAAIDVHKKLGLRHYSRSDFIVSSKGVYLLEVNTLPGLTKDSLFPKSLEADGSSLEEFLHHLIGEVLEESTS